MLQAVELGTLPYMAAIDVHDPRRGLFGRQRHDPPQHAPAAWTNFREQVLAAQSFAGAS